MKQQCYLIVIYLNWLLIVGVAACLYSSVVYALAGAWLIIAPLATWTYIRVFPSISHALGYGKVDDTPAQIATEDNRHDLQKQGKVNVNIYTALGCPFCPIVEKRLKALRQSMSFNVQKIDVTLRPDLINEQGIRAVPVIEVAGRRIQGNASSDQLSKLISGSTAALNA
jgi:glutaredoxin